MKKNVVYAWYTKIEDYFKKYNEAEIIKALSADEIYNNQNDDNIISDKNYERDKIDSNRKDNIPISLETEKSKKTYKTKMNDKSLDTIEKETEDELICWSSDGDEDIPLREGERVVGQWSF